MCVCSKRVSNGIKLGAGNVFLKTVVMEKQNLSTGGLVLIAWDNWR